MVDVAHKPSTHRIAIAESRIVMNAATLAVILQGRRPGQGDDRRARAGKAWRQVG